MNVRTGIMTGILNSDTAADTGGSGGQVSPPGATPNTSVLVSSGRAVISPPAAGVIASTSR